MQCIGIERGRLAELDTDAFLADAIPGALRHSSP
jgi:hypothetical protein